MSQGSTENSTRTQPQGERLRKAVVVLLGVAMVLVATYFGGHAVFAPPQRQPIGTHIERDGETMQEAVVADDTSEVWLLQTESAKNTLRSIPANSPATTQLTGQLDELVERVRHIEEFVKTHRFSLPAQVDSTSPLGAELVHLQTQCEQLATQVRRNELAHSHSPKADEDASALIQLDERIEASERKTVATNVASAESALRKQMQSEIARVQFDTRDLKDKHALIEQQIDVELRERKEADEKIKRQLALKRDMPEVRRLLSPFISPGHVQPNRTPWARIRTVDPEPVSLSRLENIGALKPTTKGLENLYIFGGTDAPGFTNDRPLGAFPQYFAQQLHKPHILEAVKRAQELLRLHGPALVEEKLLSP